MEQKQLLEEKIRQSENSLGYIQTKVAVEILMFVHKELHRQLLKEIIEDLASMTNMLEGDQLDELEVIEAKYQHKLKELEDTHD